jgi:hypothetical protein
MGVSGGTGEGKVMRRYLAIILAISGLAALTARAEDFWVTKDWKTWSKAECKKMLEDSPWAKRFLAENSGSNRQLPSGNNDVTHTPGSGSGNPGAGEINYHIQLRSATPVQLAFIRQKQIEQKYDSMSDAGKNAFDAEMERQMREVNGHEIVVHVVFDSTKPTLRTAVTDYWQSLPSDAIPEKVFLVTDKGSKVPPFRFSFEKGTENEFDLIFPRIVGTDPIISPDAKFVKVEFPQPALGDFPERTVTVEYIFNKMMWNGKLTY